MRAIFSLFTLIIFFSPVIQAQKIISGTVTDTDTKEPLVGASIIAVGTIEGTVTDLNGKYSFQAPADAKQLVISFIGYATSTVDIPENNKIDVALTAGNVLDQVIVTGYGGTIKQKQVASAIAIIKAHEFNAGSVANPTLLLEGKVAGLVIAQAGSDPNGVPSVRLRGTSTIAGNTEPLYVVDDVPGVPIQSVDPNDIQEVTVLKDGSAAALYGARASAGVIIVQTKKGEIGKTYVDFNTKIDVSSISNRVQNLSPDEYATAVTAAGGAPSTSSRTNWFDLITRTGISNTQNFGMSGSFGTGSTYRASFTYRNIQGNELKDGNQQLNGRLNLQQYALNDKLKFNLTINSTNRNGQPGLDYAFSSAVTFDPTQPPKGGVNSDIFGGYTQPGGQGSNNPLGIVEQTTFNYYERYLQKALGIQLEIMEGLKIKGLYSLQNKDAFYGIYYPRTSAYFGAGTQGYAIKGVIEDQNSYFQT